MGKIRICQNRSKRTVLFQLDVVYINVVCLYWLGFPPSCVGLESGDLFLVLGQHKIVSLLRSQK